MKIIQIKSSIGLTSGLKGVLRSLKLGKIGEFVEYTTDQLNSALLGRIRAIKHVLKIEGDVKILNHKKKAAKKVLTAKVEKEIKEPKVSKKKSEVSSKTVAEKAVQGSVKKVAKKEKESK